MIELTTSAFLLFSMVYGTAFANVKSDSIAPASSNIVIVDRAIVDNMALVSTGTGSNNVEAEVREYFKDTPILAEIARCESQFRHVGENGKIIRGIVNKSDIGVMQINTYYHQERAERLGLELTTLKGNMAYAKDLYEREGTAPWISSSPCWNKYVAISKK